MSSGYSDPYCLLGLMRRTDETATRLAEGSAEECSTVLSPVALMAGIIGDVRFFTTCPLAAVRRRSATPYRRYRPVTPDHPFLPRLLAKDPTSAEPTTNQHTQRVMEESVTLGFLMPMAGDVFVSSPRILAAAESSLYQCVFLFCAAAPVTDARDL